MPRIQVAVARNNAVAKLLLLAMASILAIPADAAVSLEPGIRLYKSGKYDRALAKFQRACRANVRDVNAHYYLALCYLKLNQPSKMKAELDWLQMNSKDAKLITEIKTQLDTITPRFLASNVEAPGLPKIIEFSAPGCAPCDVVGPIIERVKKTYGGKALFESLDITDEKNSEIVQKYNVTAVPAVMLVDKNGKIVMRHAGMVDEKDFENQVSRLIGR
jgi:thioredoxin 1